MDNQKQKGFSSKIFYFLPFLMVLVALFLLVQKYYPVQKINQKIETKVFETTQKIEEVRTSIAPEPTKITESGLPNYHLINTAFIPQSPQKNWDQPWQDACEESSILTGYYYYQGITPSTDEIVEKIVEIIDFETKQGWGTSINLFKVQKIYNEYLGLKSDIVDNPSIEDIKSNIAKKYPVLVPAAGKVLFTENKYFNDGGPEYHALVVLGYDDTRKKFIVHDVGTQHGAYFKYSYNLLMDSIHDFPDTNKTEDILSGPKKILVLKSNETQN